MVQYITTLSKYFITIFIMVYTLECFMVFKYKEEKTRRGIYTRQVVLIILIHFSGFLSICLKTGSLKYLIFYAVFQVLMLLIIEAVPMIYPRINRLLINNSCLLISIGLIMLTRIDFNEALKQMIIIALAFLLGGLIPLLLIKFEKIPNLPYLYGLTGITLLAIVNLLGNLTNGSKLAISVFGVSFMPSEFVKILFVLFVAGALYNDTSFKSLVITTLFAAIHVCILILSNDLGAGLILYVVYVLMVFIATRNFWYLGLGTFMGGLASFIAFKLLRHVQVRVAAFIDPFSVIDNEGYQITQSLFAIGSGSWFGLGLFGGTPETIPYVETDFIFSAITQELGIVFSICMILICLSCFIMFINISFKFENNFYKLCSIGLGISYIFQVFLTIGGGTKFIPLTGVTLPLVSYGGSSVMATIFSIFIIESMYIIRGKEGYELNDDQKIPGNMKKQSNIVLAITYLFIAVFFALCTYLCIYSATHEEELINNSYNPRQEVLITQNIRGKIYSRDNEVLAETINEKGKEEYRFYPFYNIFSHVIGYASNGKAGIEGQANYYLINSNQPLGERMTADFTGDKYLADGVITTLDVGLQKAAYTAIGTYNGAVIVSNPKTGEILACVSKPDFDPNEIDAIWDDLINDKDSSVLLNRATQGLYPPGSTFKIITLLEYIRENPESYNDYSFNCNGELRVDEGKIICYNHQAHGYVDLKKSFAISCNSSFGNIGLKLDRDKFQNTLDDLLFNSELPLSMNYSESTAKVSNDFDEITMVRTAFGQGDTLMTPMHLNMITSAIANEGKIMKPYLVSSVVNSNMNTVKEFAPSEYKTVLSKEESDIVKEMMRAVITSGTGKKLNNDKYTVCGKTGSAEFSDYSKSTHSWFTGFAPMDDPEICVTIILENAGSGNLYAVPMAKKIFDEYFRRFDTSEYKEE